MTPAFFLYFDFSLIYTHIKLYFATIKFGDKFYIRVAYKNKSTYIKILCCVLHNHTQTQIQTNNHPQIFPGGEFFSLTFLIFLLFFWAQPSQNSTNKKSYCMLPSISKLLQHHFCYCLVGKFLIVLQWWIKTWTFIFYRAEK